MRGVGAARFGLCLLFHLLLATLPLRAEQIVAGLSQSNIAITANYVGSEILIFGAIQRDAPAPDGPLEVVITLEGPSGPLTVRRKTHVNGIWVNTDKLIISRAPHFYAVSTTTPLSSALSATEDLRHHVSIPRAIRAVGAASVDESPRYFDALIRLCKAEGLYQLQEGTVDLAQNTLFRTSIILPANLAEGSYKTRIFLTRGGQVVDTLETSIMVQKEGLERLLFALAHEQPVAYGSLSLAIAILAGWAAAAVFRMFWA